MWSSFGLSLCGACAVFNLFSSRPRSTDNAQFKQKLPDFVRRLEEALYRTAATKVLLPLPRDGACWRALAPAPPGMLSDRCCRRSISTHRRWRRGCRT